MQQKRKMWDLTKEPVTQKYSEVCQNDKHTGTFQPIKTEEGRRKALRGMSPGKQEISI